MPLLVDGELVSAPRSEAKGPAPAVADPAAKKAEVAARHEEKLRAMQKSTTEGQE